MITFPQPVNSVDTQFFIRFPKRFRASNCSEHNYCVSAARKFSGHAIFHRVSDMFPRLVNPVDTQFFTGFPICFRGS